ncbi:NUDIX hydrolase domain-like protein [Aspergillus varians]
MGPQFNYTVAPHLEEFTVSFATFRAARPKYVHYVGGALIFSRIATCPEYGRNGTGKESEGQTQGQQRPLRILLLQRAFEDSYGGQWEGPGGSCDPEDETILDGVAREVLEESGLHVSRFVELAGKHEWVKLRPDRVELAVKYTFIVEVHEARPAVPGDGQDENGLPTDKLEKGTVVPGLGRRWEEKVKLAPAEHRAFEWVTEEEVREGDENESGKYKSFGNQGKTILDAFQMFRERPGLVQGGGDA